MASVLNRTTKQFLSSVNTPDYSPADWIIDPDLSAVVGYPSIYWAISGDSVTLMSQAERDAVDAVIADAEKDEIANRLTVSAFDKAFALIMLDEINTLRGIAGLSARTPAQLKNALRNKL